MVSLKGRRVIVDEQKKNRLAAAVTVNVILLVAILAIVIVYQLVTIVATNKKIAETKSEIEKYESLIDESKNTLEKLQDSDYLLYYAMQNLHFRFPD